MRFARQTRTIPLIAIGIAAALFLIVTYQYSSYTLTQIDKTAVDDIHSTAQVQVTDSASLLVAKLEGIASSVEVISKAASQDSPADTRNLLFSAQVSTNGFTEDYFWMSSNGTLVALNNGTEESVASYAGSNYTSRPYFAGPENADGLYVTGAVPSLTNASDFHVFVSDAVTTVEPGTNITVFNGVIGAAIDLTSLGTFLQNGLATGFSNSQLDLLDANATVLYSGEAGLIGQNLFSKQIQGELPVSLVHPLDNLINESLSGATGVSDITVNGNNETIAYAPVLLQQAALASETHQFGVLYVLVPDTIEGSYAALLSQLRVLSSFVIVGIAGIAIASAVLLLGWNRRLDDTVTKRTADLVAANEQLKAYAQSQTDFVNIAAHELRTPTQSILGFTEILQDATKNGPAQTEAGSGVNIDEAVNSISNNARRLKKLTDDILTVSRIDNNRMTISRENFDLDNAIRDVIEEMKKGGAAGRKGEYLDIKFDQETASLPVSADPTKIHEVLSNLLTNAVRFSDGKGTITIQSGRTPDNQAIVSIKDQGKGIDPEILPKLFNKFVTTSPSGTGLGLFIASKLVAAHGGRMWAQNNVPPESGSTFTFTLPLETEAAKSTKDDS